MVGARGGRRERGHVQWGRGRRERTGWVGQDLGGGDRMGAVEGWERREGELDREEGTDWVEQEDGRVDRMDGARGGRRRHFKTGLVGQEEGHRDKVSGA